MTDFATLGIRIESQGADKASRDLNELATASDRAERSSDRLEGQSRQTARATDALDREVRQATASTAQLGRVSGTATASIGRLAASFVAFSAASFGLSASAQVLAGFEQSMAQVSAVTRSTEADLMALRETAKTLGATTEFSASQAAEGLRFLGMAGFDAEQSIKAIPAVLNLATAASMDLGRSADITSNIMSAFGISAGQASSVADILAAASSRANTDVAQLGDAMRYVGPVASAFNVSMNDTAAAIGALSDAGIQGSLAGTGLRRILSSLANATPEATSAIRAMGLQLDDLNPKTNSIVDIVSQLAAGGLEAADALTIFGDRGGPAILALVENLPKLRTLTQTLRDVEGEASRMADTMRDNLAGDFKNLASAVESLIISFGESGMTGALRSMTQLLTGTVRLLADNVGILSAAINGLLGYAIAPWALGAARGLSALAGAAGTASAAVGGLAKALALVSIPRLAFGVATAGVYGLYNAYSAAQSAAQEYQRAQDAVNRAMDQSVEPTQKATNAVVAKAKADVAAAYAVLQKLDAELAYRKNISESIPQTPGAADPLADTYRRIEEGRRNLEALSLVFKDIQLRANAAATAPVEGASETLSQAQRLFMLAKEGLETASASSAGISSNLSGIASSMSQIGDNSLLSAIAVRNEIKSTSDELDRYKEIILSARQLNVADVLGKPQDVQRATEALDNAKDSIAKLFLAYKNGNAGTATDFLNSMDMIREGLRQVAGEGNAVDPFIDGLLRAIGMSDALIAKLKQLRAAQAGVAQAVGTGIQNQNVNGSGVSVTRFGGDDSNATDRIVSAFTKETRAGVNVTSYGLEQNRTATDGVTNSVNSLNSALGTGLANLSNTVSQGFSGLQEVTVSSWAEAIALWEKQGGIYGSAELGSMFGSKSSSSGGSTGKVYSISTASTSSMMNTTNNTRQGDTVNNNNVTLNMTVAASATGSRSAPYSSQKLASDVSRRVVASLNEARGG